MDEEDFVDAGWGGVSLEKVSRGPVFFYKCWPC
jgi:hypothetical protein